MPAPLYLSAWNPAAAVAAHTSLVGLLDSDASPATLVISDVANTVLATFTLTDPCGTVNGTTGVLTLTAPGDATAVATGVAFYATLNDGAGTIYRSFLCADGDAPIANYCVLSSLAVETDAPVSLTAFTIT